MAGPNSTTTTFVPIAGTSIQTPTTDPANLQRVGQQLKEAVEIGQRLRGNVGDSFVRVSELQYAFGARVVNNTIQPPSSGSSSSGTVSVSDSITGDGSSGSPLQLSGDSASPGNSKVYGTNGSGTKGWYAASGSSSLTVTDGTNSVANTTQITFSGATVSGTSPNATVTVSGGGSTPTPETLPNLVYWFDASIINSNSGGRVPVAQNLAPGHISNTPFCNASPPFTISGTQLNGKNVVLPSGAACYLWPSTGANSGLYLLSSTIFAVWYCTSAALSATQSIISTNSGNSGGLQYCTDGAGHMQLSHAFVAVIASDTYSLTANTWYQSNVTYGSGAWSFRNARTAGGSGTGGAAITNYSVGFLGTPGYGQYMSGSIAEVIVYDRILSNTEITTIESYLHTKWGV